MYLNNEMICLMMQLSNTGWLAIFVNGENATSRSDDLVLEDEAKYILELK